jgi:large subunit ribosomal protein L15
LIRDEVRLHELSHVEGDVVDLETLRKADLISGTVLRVKIIAAGGIDRAVIVRSVAVTRGARAAIEAAGGRVEE